MLPQVVPPQKVKWAWNSKALWNPAKEASKRFRMKLPADVTLCEPAVRVCRNNLSLRGKNAHLKVLTSNVELEVSLQEIVSWYFIQQLDVQQKYCKCHFIQKHNFVLNRCANAVAKVNIFILHTCILPPGVTGWDFFSILIRGGWDNSRLQTRSANLMFILIVAYCLT